MMNDHKLRLWLTNRFQDEPPCVRVSLIHASEMGAEIVGTWLVGEVDNLDAEVVRIADAIHSSAIDHIECFPGPQRFRVSAITEDGEEVANHSFKLEGALSSELELVPRQFGAGEEPPTTAGVTGQLMRHVERKEQMMVRLTEALVGHLITENQSLRKSEERYHELRLQEVETIEELFSLKHQRDLEQQENEASIQMKREALNQALRFAPAVLGHILKRKGIDTDVSRVPKGLGPGPGCGQPQEPQQGKTNGVDSVESFQSKMRLVVKALGGASTIKNDVAEEHYGLVDSLLGVGEDPSSVEEYRDRLGEFIEELSPEMLLRLDKDLSDELKRELAHVMGV